MARSASARAFDIGRIPRPGIDAERQERRLDHVLRRIEDVDAAIREPGGDLRIEEQRPGIERHVAKPGADRIDVDAEPAGAPHVVDAIEIAGVVGRQEIRDPRPHMREIGELRLVELQKRPGADLSRHARIGGHDDVVSRLAGKQLGLEDLVAVIDVVDDPDAGLRGEGVEHRLVDIVGPVVDVDDPVGRRGRSGGRGDEGGGHDIACIDAARRRVIAARRKAVLKTMHHTLARRRLKKGQKDKRNDKSPPRAIGAQEMTRTSTPCGTRT